MKIKVRTATRKQLNWMIAHVIGAHGLMGDESFDPAGSWNDGSPLVKLFGIYIKPVGEGNPGFIAVSQHTAIKDEITGVLSWRTENILFGSHALIAAMRCLICAEYGDEVECPLEICNEQRNTKSEIGTSHFERSTASK